MFKNHLRQLLGGAGTMLERFLYGLPIKFGNIIKASSTELNINKDRLESNISIALKKNILA